MAPGGAKPFSGTGEVCAGVKRALILASRTLALAVTLICWGLVAAPAQAQVTDCPSISASGEYLILDFTIDECFSSRGSTPSGYDPGDDYILIQRGASPAITALNALDRSADPNTLTASVDGESITNSTATKNCSAGCTVTGTYGGVPFSSFVYTWSGSSGTTSSAPPAAPEINVTGNGVTIADGDGSARTADHTDFGTVDILSGSVTRTYTISNTGTGALTLGTNAASVSGTNPGDFTVTSQPATSVAAGGSTTVTLRFDPTATGTRNAVLSIANDDSDESPYNFALRGGGSAAAEISVTGNGANIVDGAATASTSNHTDFGSADVLTETITRTFTITNAGSAYLTLGSNAASVSGPSAANFTITAQPAFSLAPGDSTSVSVQFDPDANGTHSATLSIDNNDSDESPFDFAIEGTGTGATPPPTVTLSVSTISASEGDGSVVLTATKSSPTSEATIVNLSYSGTATGSGVDYTGPASITIPANATSQTTQISFVDDAIDEDDKTIIVDIASVTGGNGASEDGVQQLTVTLTDNDPTPSLRVENAQAFEAAGVLAFPVNLSAASARTITVDYASGGAMASSGTDFTAASGTLTFSPGETSKNINVPLIDDGVVERNEMLSMTLSSATNATISRALGTGTINNDDSATLSIADVQNQEGAGLTFTLTLSAPVDTDIRYYARTTDGTAQAGDDYTALASGSSRTISAGVQTVSLPVTITDDGVPEADETFTVTLFDLDAGGARDVTLGDDSATGTILNDDQYPDVTLSASPTTISENGGTSTLTATLSATSTQDVTVSLAYSNANATGPASIVVPAGDLTATGTVTAVDNAVDEPDRTVEVSVDSVTNGVEDGVQAVTLTVTDDEDAPSLSIADVSLTEGASGTKAMTFTASLSAASARTVTVDYATSSGTATANVDFDTASGTLTFSPGQTQQTFDVTISSENRVELDESFTVTLSSATNATIADASATGTILNDDSATISIADGQRLEGDSSDNSLNLLVSMSAPVDVSVSLTVTTADRTATAPADYYAVSAAPYSIADGQMGRFIPVSTKADTVFEPDETFTVTLADLDASGRAVTFSDATATVTIRNDDAAPEVTLSASPTTIPENGGTSTLTATLSTTSTEDVTVALAYSNANATGPASIVVPAGDLTATGTVTAVDNAIDEPDRTVEVSVDSVTNGTESGTQAVTLTLTDDEGASSLSIADASLGEGASGTSVMTFTASLSPASGQTVTVDYATSDNTATAGSDYTAALGTLTFTPGQTQQTFDVTVSGDNVVELSETFTVTLSSATNATISDASATGTITNDDSATLTLSDSGLYETEADQLVSLRATLSAPVDTSVRFEASTADGTATAPADYDAVVDWPWSINTGLTTLDLVFTVKGDAAFEPDEAFTVLLTNLTASGRDVTFADASANVRILNNDSTPNVTLSVSPTTIPENGGTSTLTATLSATSIQDVTVALAYSNAEVTGPASIVVPAGSPSATALVTAVDNALDEPDRTVVVSVDSVTNGTENATQAVTLTVTDDEGAPTLSVANVTIDESDGAAVLAMILDAPSAQPVTVFWSTEDDSAVASDDYTAVFDKAEVIPAGETHLDLIVTINDDSLEEVAETFTLKFSGVSGAVAANSEAVVTIRASDLDTPAVRLSTSAPDRVSGMFEVAIDFSESVTGFDMTDFALVNATAGNLAGSGASYTVEITPTGNGVVSIELPAASIEDAAGNANTASNTITRQADGTAPELTILLPDAETHGAFTASFTFSEDVTGCRQTNANSSLLSADEPRSGGQKLAPFLERDVTL